MSISYWTAPELRAAITAANAGGTYIAISKQLQKLGYTRSAEAVAHRLRTSGVASSVPNRRWSAQEIEALRAAYANRTDLRAACPGRSMKGISTKAKLLGLVYSSYNDISEELADAREIAAESFAAAPNSYGSGYDAGYVAGMLKCRQIMLGGNDE